MQKTASLLVVCLAGCTFLRRNPSQSSSATPSKRDSDECFPQLQFAAITRHEGLPRVQLSIFGPVMQFITGWQGNSRENRNPRQRAASRCSTRHANDTQGHATCRSLRAPFYPIRPGLTCRERKLRILRFSRLWTRRYATAQGNWCI